MSQIQPPPTYAEVMLKGTNGEAFFNPIWLDWFLTLAAVISASGGSSGTLQHNSLSGLQGGSANEYYHVTASQDTLIGALAGLSTGIISITGTGTAAVRTITGTANEITVTDGNGVAGDPIISFPTAVTFPGTAQSTNIVPGQEVTVTSAVSGIVYQNTNAFPITIYQPVTFSPTALIAATCAVALGATITPSTIFTNSEFGDEIVIESIGLTPGSVSTHVLVVPPKWYYSFTTTQATLGTTVAFTGMV